GLDPRDLKVLVIDPNAVHRSIVCEQLASWGLHAATASDDTEALRRIDQGSKDGRPFTAIIVDSKMCAGRPADLVRSLRKAAPRCHPAILLLGGVEVETEQGEPSQNGFDGHIVRPVRQ